MARWRRPGVARGGRGFALVGRLPNGSSPPSLEDADAHMQNEIEKGGGWRSRWKGVFVPFFISFSFFTDRRWDKEAVGDALRGEQLHCIGCLETEGFGLTSWAFGGPLLNSSRT